MLMLQDEFLIVLHISSHILLFPLVAQNFEGKF